MRSVETGYLSYIAEILRKTASPHAKFDWNHELWPKMIFKMAAVCHLKFIKFSYLVRWLSTRSKCAAVYRISSKSDDFSSRYFDLTICNMSAVSHVESPTCRVYVTWPTSPCYHASLCKLSLKSDNRLQSYGQKTIFKWRPSGILNFNNFNIWSCNSHLLPNLLLCTKFHRSRVTFHWYNGDFKIFKMADLRNFEFYRYNNGFFEKLT